jgi:threonine dehydrogenase-like Zn-dependent dehydrogenase
MAPNGGITPGHRVCVIGTGPFGPTAVKTPLAAGAYEVVCFDEGAATGNVVFDEGGSRTNVYESTHISSCRTEPPEKIAKVLRRKHQHDFAAEKLPGEPGRTGGK